MDLNYRTIWMLDIQLGRRNLSPIQRISITEKYRPIYEKQARENQLNALKQNQNTVLPNLVKRESIDTTKKLAEVANVGKETYRMGKKILDSDNKEVKEKVLSGEMSINAGYNKIKETAKQKENIDNETTNTQSQTTQNESQKPKISDKTKQICADLKTEKYGKYGN